MQAFSTFARNAFAHLATVQAEEAKRRATRRRRLLTALASVVLTTGGGLTVISTAPVASAASGGPSGVQFTLTGCRNDGTITLPNGSGQYVCPGNTPSPYTTGNLGKGWNELDLVPFRLETKASTPSPNPFTVEI
ncbi:MAG: hypothetical protein ACREOE_08245, partial [Gemmatimonadales bacterium]